MQRSVRGDTMAYDYSSVLGHIYGRRRGRHWEYWLVYENEVCPVTREFVSFAIRKRGLVLEIVEPHARVVVGDLLPMGVVNEVS